MMIEYAREYPPHYDEEEQFECDICQELYPENTDYATKTIVIPYGRKNIKLVKYVCVYCVDDLNSSLKR